MEEFIVHAWSSSDMQLRHVQGTYLLDQIHFKNYVDKEC